MHISEGVLTTQVLAGSAIIAGAGLAMGLRELRPERVPKVAVLSSAFFTSCLTWLCIFATCYLVLLSFEVVDPTAFTFGVSIVGTTALNVTCVLPINGLGNLGTWEAGW